jgi:hypothetical protein
MQYIDKIVKLGGKRGGGILLAFQQNKTKIF